jgi:catechol 2,3-dioxygenase-like lactoylglutathione lyase family enzyme
MAVRRFEHVGINVDDLPAAIEFFVELGLEQKGEASVEGDLVGRVIGLEDVRSDIAILQAPDGGGQIELVKFNSPPATGGDPSAPSNARGIRHITFAVEDIDSVVAGLRARGTEFVGEVENYEDIYRLCYVRGPEGIIVELAEKLG